MDNPKGDLERERESAKRRDAARGRVHRGDGEIDKRKKNDLRLKITSLGEQGTIGKVVFFLGVVCTR